MTEFNSLNIDSGYYNTLNESFETQVAEVIVEEVEKNITSITDTTGLEEWDSEPPQWTFNRTTGEYSLLTGGKGWIQGKEVTWTSGQTISLIGNSTEFYIGISPEGILTSITGADSHTRMHTDYVNIMYIVTDESGSYYIACTEAHKTDFGSIEQVIFNTRVLGSSISGNPLIKVAGTSYPDFSKLVIYDNGILEDSGLTTNISHTGTTTINFMNCKKTDSGLIGMIPNDHLEAEYYDPATGNNVACDVGKFCIYTIGVMKNNLLNSDPQYICLPYTKQYDTRSDAIADVNNNIYPRVESIFPNAEAGMLGVCVVKKRSVDTHPQIKRIIILISRAGMNVSTSVPQQIISVPHDSLYIDSSGYGNYHTISNGMYYQDPGSSWFTLQVSPGEYTEDITFTYDNFIIAGIEGGPDRVQIIGDQNITRLVKFRNVTFNLSDTNQILVNHINIEFDNCIFIGNYTTSTSMIEIRYTGCVMTNCQFIQTSTNPNSTIWYINTAYQDADLVVSNSEISQSITYGSGNVSVVCGKIYDTTTSNTGKLTVLRSTFGLESIASNGVAIGWRLFQMYGPNLTIDLTLIGNTYRFIVSGDVYSGTQSERISYGMTTTNHYLRSIDNRYLSDDSGSNFQLEPVIGPLSNHVMIRDSTDFTDVTQGTTYANQDIRIVASGTTVTFGQRQELRMPTGSIIEADSYDDSGTLKNSVQGSYGQAIRFSPNVGDFEIWQNTSLNLNDVLRNTFRITSAGYIYSNGIRDIGSTPGYYKMVYNPTTGEIAYTTV